MTGNSICFLCREDTLEIFEEVGVKSTSKDCFDKVQKCLSFDAVKFVFCQQRKRWNF